MTSSETPYDSLGPAARKAVVEALERERFGPMKDLEEEKPTRYVLTDLIATLAGLYNTPPATSSRTSTEMGESSLSSTGARSAATSTPWESDVRFANLAELNRKYDSDRAFAHLRSTSRFVPGDGPADSPQFMLIGEAPGATEDREQRPFVGASGKLLTTMLWELRVHRKNCYVTNVVKYRPPNNRRPSIEEIDAATPYLREEVKLVYPAGGVVILLGATALALVNDDKRVIKDQAQPFVQGRWTFVPMAHPSYVLQGRMKRQAYVDAWASLAELVKKESAS